MRFLWKVILMMMTQIMIYVVMVLGESVAWDRMGMVVWGWWRWWWGGVCVWGISRVSE